MIRSTVAEPSPWAGSYYERMAAEDPDTCDMCGDDTWDGEEFLGGVLCPECAHIERESAKVEG